MKKESALVFTAAFAAALFIAPALRAETPEKKAVNAQIIFLNKVSSQGNRLQEIERLLDRLGLLSPAGEPCFNEACQFLADARSEYGSVRIDTEIPGVEKIALGEFQEARAVYSTGTNRLIKNQSLIAKACKAAHRLARGGGD